MFIKFRVKQKLHKKRIDDWLYFFADETVGNMPALKYDKEKLRLLDFDCEGRSVYLDRINKTVVKFNKFSRVRAAVKSRLALNKNKYSLKEEFENLLQLPHVDFLPDVYAYAVCGGFFSKKEKLIINYFEDSITVDKLAESGSVRPEDIAFNVGDLFMEAWGMGFAHMDPHPKNMLVVDGSYKLIDFECCKIDPDCKDFYFGFSFGYFYHFWFNKFIAEDVYDQVVWSFVNEKALSLNEELFSSFYEYFKSEKVSRRERYKAFSNRNLREKMINGQSLCNID